MQALLSVSTSLDVGNDPATKSPASVAVPLFSALDSSLKGC